MRVHRRVLAVMVTGVTIASCSGPDLVDSLELESAVSAVTFEVVLAATGKCMDINAQGRADGTNIQQWTCNGTPAQSFTLEQLGADTYRLLGTQSGKCVDVNRARHDDGTNIQLWTCNGTGAQSFRVEDLGGGLSRIINTQSNKCVDVSGGRSEDGTNIQLWRCNGTGAQAFRFVKQSNGDASTPSSGSLTNRARAIPVGIENVNDSPLKAANYRTMIRFVPDSNITIDRFYFGFKLRGASCSDAGNAGYGSGNGGTLDATLVAIDPTTGLPTTSIAHESVNACTRYSEALAELRSTPVLAWANLRAALEGGKMYGFIVRNSHSDPARNFFSFNMPLADTALAGPHARNELSKSASGNILGLDPREHVAWSSDSGKSWQYGSANGQYRSFMNDRDTAHPATRIPQYGFRLANGLTLAVQPYYAYSTDCTACSVTYENARYARRFSELGGFTASGRNVGTLTITNTTTRRSSSCTPAQGYGFRKCSLSTPIDVAVGESYSVSCTGTVEVMEMDNSQRVLFPNVGSSTGEIRMFQANPAPGTNAKDIPNLWAGPISAHHPI